jgi:hypothetical protein
MRQLAGQHRQWHQRPQLKGALGAEPSAAGFTQRDHDKYGGGE